MNRMDEWRCSDKHLLNLLLADNQPAILSTVYCRSPVTGVKSLVQPHLLYRASSAIH